MTALETLALSPLVHGLNPSQVQLIAELAVPAGFAAGEAVTTLNEPDSDLYVLGSGRVQLLTHDGDVLGEVAAGGLVGEIAFLDGRPRTAHSLALTLVTGIRFPAQDLRRLMVRDKEIGFKVLANLSIVLAQRMRLAIGQLDSLMDVQHDVWTNRT